MSPGFEYLRTLPERVNHRREHGQRALVAGCKTQRKDST
jgi:hypothetical protein